MAHSCALCGTPLVERPTLILKTIHVICADCLGNVKQYKGLKKTVKRLALAVDSTEAHIVMALGASHTTQGFSCLEEDKEKFMRWLQTATGKGGISPAVISTPALVSLK